jgi:hypothetical protein
MSRITQSCSNRRATFMYARWFPTLWVHLNIYTNSVMDVYARRYMLWGGDWIVVYSVNSRCYAHHEPPFCNGSDWFDSSFPRNASIH